LNFRKRPGFRGAFACVPSINDSLEVMGGEFIIMLRLALEQRAAMVPPSVVVKDGMGGRLARSFLPECCH
jgi:hypothetical protein